MDKDTPSGRQEDRKQAEDGFRGSDSLLRHQTQEATKGHIVNTYNKDIEMDIADTIMERPHAFSVGGRRFFLYPPTLGKTYLLLRLIESLGMDAEIIKANPFMESLRLCREKKDTVCRLLAYHTIGSREDLFDGEVVDGRCKFLSENLSCEEMARLLVMTLSAGNTEEFMKYLGIDRDREELARISKLKDKDSGTLTFGGKSVFGSLILPACEKLNMTPRQVVWEISYPFLQMLLADAVTSLYLTDEERKDTRFSVRQAAISADDPANAARIMEMFR